MCNLLPSHGFGRKEECFHNAAISKKKKKKKNWREKESFVFLKQGLVLPNDWGWPGTCCLDQTGLKLEVIILLLPPEC